MNFWAKTRRTPAPQRELFQLFEEEPGGSRPPCLGEPRGPQERVQPHIREQLAEVVPMLQVLDFHVVLEGGGGGAGGDQLVAVLKAFDFRYRSPSWSRRRSSRFAPRTQFHSVGERADHVDIPVPSSRASSSSSRTAEGGGVRLPVRRSPAWLFFTWRSRRALQLKESGGLWPCTLPVEDDGQGDVRRVH